jgi:SulP family sulfate permease
MLRRSSPSQSPPDHDDRDDKSSQGGSDEELNRAQGRLIMTSNGVEVDTTERTPLLGKDDIFESPHRDWIQGQRDLEGQDLRRKVSWPKLRNIVSWPRERGYDIAATVFTPKRWNRQAILRNAVLDPIGYIPAVILGSLLNVLDALSYGM